MPTVLIIDDEAPVRKTLRMILEKSGFKVREASNGRLGVESFQGNAADLVITDIIMPEQEGIETIMAIRTINADTPIIAMSGGGRVGNMNFLEMAQDMGANAVLPKPIKPANLLGAIRQSLGLPQ